MSHSYSKHICCGNGRLFCVKFLCTAIFQEYAISCCSFDLFRKKFDELLTSHEKDKKYFLEEIRRLQQELDSANEVS